MRRLVGLIVLGMVVVIVFIGCPTRYQKTGATGGYSDARIDANTFLVEFHGNGFTSRQTVETYLLYRCAEVTVEAGYDFFVIVGGGVETNDSTNTTTTPGHFASSTSGTATTSGSAMAFGNMATGSATTSGSATTTGTYTAPQTNTYTITTHGGSVRIKGFKGEKPTDNPNAYDARELLKYLGPSIK